MLVHTLEKQAGLLFLWSCLLWKHTENNHRSIIWEWCEDALSEEVLEEKDCFTCDHIEMEQSLLESNQYGRSHFVDPSFHLHVE